MTPALSPASEFGYGSREGKHLPFQPASARATDFLLLLRVVAGFMPAVGGWMIFDLA